MDLFSLLGNSGSGCGNSKTKVSRVVMVGIFFGFLGSGRLIVGYFSFNFVCVSRSSQAFPNARFRIRFLSDVLFALSMAFCSCGTLLTIVLAFR